MRYMSIAAVTVLVGALSMPSPVSAQTHGSNVRMGGFKVGVATSSTKPADLVDAPDGETVAGLSAGVFGRIPLGRNTAAQGEILFLKQGTNLGELELRSSMLRVPVSVQYLIPTNSVGLRVYAGGNLDLPLSCSPDGITLEVDIFGTPRQQTFDGCPIEHSDFRFGLIGGALVDLMLGGSVLTLDVRYDHGLSDLDGRAGAGFFSAIEFANLQGFRGFEVTLGVGL